MKPFFGKLRLKAGSHATDDESEVLERNAEGPAGIVALPPPLLPESVPPLEPEQDSRSESDQVALPLGEILERIPRHLLKSCEWDLNRTLLFDLADLSDRITRGITTVPLALVVAAAPDIFNDEANSQQTTVILFPWQRIFDLIKDSDKSDGNNKRSVRQRIQRHGKNVSIPFAVAGTDVENRTKGATDPTSKERADYTKTNVWFGTKKGANGDGAIGRELFLKNSGAVTPCPPGAGKEGAKLAAGEAIYNSAPALFVLPAPGASKAEPPAGPEAVSAAGAAALSPDAFQGIAADYEGRVATLTVQHESALRTAQTEIDDLRNELQRTLGESAQARGLAVAQVAEERDALLREKDMAIKEREERLANITRDFEAALTALRAAFKGRIREMEAAAAASERKITDLNTEHQRALEEGVQARERAVAQIAEERDALIREKDMAIKERRERLANLLRNHEVALTALREEFEAKVREKETAAVANEAQIASLKNEHQRALEESVQAREQAIARIAGEGDALMREKEAAIQAREERLAILTVGHETALIALQEEFEAKVCEMETEAAASEATIAGLKNEHQRAMEDGVQTREQAVAQIAEEVAERTGELEARDQAAAQLEDEMVQYRRRIKTVLSERDELQRKLESERRAHTNVLDSAKYEFWQLQAEHERMLRDMTGLRTQLAQKGNALQEHAARLAMADIERAKAIARLEAEHEWDISQIVLEVQNNLRALHCDIAQASQRREPSLPS